MPWAPSVPPLTAGGETGAALWSQSEEAGAAVPSDVSNLVTTGQELTSLIQALSTSVKS